MANQWLRLWHDLPNDPKWRTIARVSKQRIGDVIAVYLHVLVDASSNETERGRTQSVCVEDDHRPIITEHALIVEAMHAALPWHERMVIIAEYPQKNAMFGHLDARARIKTAQDWIARTTGVSLTETEYKLYLGLFRNQVERRLA